VNVVETYPPMSKILILGVYFGRESSRRNAIAIAGIESLDQDLDLGLQPIGTKIVDFRDFAQGVAAVVAIGKIFTLPARVVSPVTPVGNQVI
jgi:hypothetical protein